MTIHKSLFFFFIVTFMLFSCDGKQLNSAVSKPKTGQTIIPDSGREGERKEENTLTLDEEEEDSHLIPSIPIEAKWNIVKLMDANLDSDTDEEQIIILEPKEKEEGKENPLEIWISDYSTSSNSYALTWKGVLSIESGETLNITVNESPMQGRYEIYILGYDSRDYHTMDMFFPQSEESPQYRNIFSQSVKGTIELYSPQIAGSSLSDDYGTRVRISPQIIVTQADENSSNPLDSVITTWELTQSPPRYKVVSTKKIRATKEQEEMILGLINGPVENFEAILSDYWYKEEGENGFIRMINLSGDEKTVELLTLQNFEQLIWTSSYKSSYAARLYIYGTSKYISSVREKIVIDMVDRDSINLSIYDNGSQNRNLSWSGKYKRMTEGMKLSLIKEYVREINMKEYDLKGKYKSATGEEISFDNSSFTLTQEGKSEVQSGYFTLFVLNGEQLMELIFYDERGIKKKQEQYLFSYAMEDDREHRIRSIQLIPGETDAHGFIPSSDERERRFEQIELLSD